MKNKLIASSPSLDGILKIINDYWYRKDVELVKSEDSKKQTYNIKLLNVKKESRIITDFVVVKVDKRYRFEEVI